MQQLPTEDQIKEAPFWETLRQWVAKIPTKVYFAIGSVVSAVVLIIQFPGLFGLDPTQPWFKYASFVVGLLYLLFTRPKAPIDTALDEAAKAKIKGNELAANRIAEKVVEEKASRLQKKAA